MGFVYAFDNVSTGSFEDELAEKSARLAELDASLDMDGNTPPVHVPDFDDRPGGEVAATSTVSAMYGSAVNTPEAVSAQAKPSLLEALNKGVEKSLSVFEILQRVATSS